MSEFRVYGADGCSYCVKAKNALDDSGDSYEYIDIAMDAEARSYLKNELKVRTIPQVFHGNKHIGGYTELIKYLSDAK